MFDLCKTTRCHTPSCSSRLCCRCSRAATCMTLIGRLLPRSLQRNGEHASCPHPPTRRCRRSTSRNRGILRGGCVSTGRHGSVASCCIHHGWRQTQPVKPRLTEQQARDLRLCYNLIDLDKGGSIDVDELETAFKVWYTNRRRPKPPTRSTATGHRLHAPRNGADDGRGGL